MGVRRSLRAAFLIDRWDPLRGGAERALSALSNHLERRGDCVRAFALEGAPGEFERVNPRLALTRAGRERRLGHALMEGAETWKADVTIGVRHLPRVDLYWPHGGAHAVTHAAIREARAWRSDAPAVREPSAPRGRHRAFIEMERRLIEGGNARAVACVSKLVHDEFLREYPTSSAPLFLAENGVDLERFHPRERALGGARLRHELEIGAQDALIVFCGRNPVLKGLPVLLEALARCGTTPWKLLIAGPQRARDWIGHAARLCIERDRLRALDHADGAALAAAADIVAVPTWRDPCLLVVLEALASGTPVVTTTRAGASDCVRTKVHGRVVAPGDVVALHTALEELLEASRREVDRDAVRAAVLGRGELEWLRALEMKLVELTASGARRA